MTTEAAFVFLWLALAVAVAFGVLAYAGARKWMERAEKAERAAAHWKAQAETADAIAAGVLDVLERRESA